LAFKKNFTNETPIMRTATTLADLQNPGRLRQYRKRVKRAFFEILQKLENQVENPNKSKIHTNPLRSATLEVVKETSPHAELVKIFKVRLAGPIRNLMI
jgi:hypothetical protein